MKRNSRIDVRRVGAVAFAVALAFGSMASNALAYDATYPLKTDEKTIDSADDAWLPSGGYTIETLGRFGGGGSDGG